MNHTQPYVLKYASLDKLQQLAQSAALDHWLSNAECVIYDQWCNPQRRCTWLAGRILAKQLILQQLRQTSVKSIAHNDIEISTGLPRSKRERPQVSIAGGPYSKSLSITHTTRGVMVALSTHSDLRIGVDLVDSLSFNPGFVSQWFTESEPTSCSNKITRTHQIATIWAMKEALYKAYNNGEGFAPRRIEVLSTPEGSYSCSYRGQTLDGNFILKSWQVDRQVAALVIGPPLKAMQELSHATSSIPSNYEISI